jgi:hypothetical protein
MKKNSIMALRKFVNSPEGRDWMFDMRENIPGISPGPSEEIIFGAGISEGWRRCLAKIEDLSIIDTPSEDLENK